jgi:ectoine hydroxylase-related dioxygenase (phytanoyl-CoA dioxygenase family)
VDSPYPLSRRQIAEYQRDGHILLKNVAAREEIARWRPRLRQVVHQASAKADTQGRIEEYASLFLQVTNIWRMDEDLRKVVFSQRCARIAAELMGVNAVRLYHDQALFKPAGGSPTPWHQDQFYWPLDTEKTVTMWMPLIDLAEEMGTMTFASGSHVEGPLLNASISAEAGEAYARLVRERGYPVRGRAMAAGDATFHAGWTLHAARGNASQTVREVLTVIYFAAGARLVEPGSEFRRADLQAFFPGQRPGEIAASPLNPLLYSAGD